MIGRFTGWFFVDIVHFAAIEVSNKRVRYGWILERRISPKSVIFSIEFLKVKSNSLMITYPRSVAAFQSAEIRQSVES